MAMRMKTYLRKKQAEPNYNPRTWAWVNGCWRPIKNHRFIKRGKRKGWVEVELHYPEGKKVVVPVTNVRFASTTDTTNSTAKLKKSQKSGK